MGDISFGDNGKKIDLNKAKKMAELLGIGQTAIAGSLGQTENDLRRSIRGPRRIIYGGDSIRW